MKDIHFPITQRDQKAQLEGLPGFRPSMYQAIQYGEINWRKIASGIKKEPDKNIIVFNEYE